MDAIQNKWKNVRFQKYSNNLKGKITLRTENRETEGDTENNKIGDLEPTMPKITIMAMVKAL